MVYGLGMKFRIEELGVLSRYLRLLSSGATILGVGLGYMLGSCQGLGFSIQGLAFRNLFMVQRFGLRSYGVQLPC